MAFPFQLYKDKGKKEKNVGETKIPQGFSDLGGGNSTSCYFHPDPLGNDPIWRSHIFQRPTSYHQLVTRTTN